MSLSLGHRFRAAALALCVSAGVLLGGHAVAQAEGSGWGRSDRSVALPSPTTSATEATPVRPAAVAAAPTPVADVGRESAGTYAPELWRRTGNRRTQLALAPGPVAALGAFAGTRGVEALAPSARPPHQCPRHRRASGCIAPAAPRAPPLAS